MTLQVAGATYRYPAVRASHRSSDSATHEPTFHAEVARLPRDPAAEATYPDVVHQLRRLRDAFKPWRTRRAGCTIYHFMRP